MFYAHISLDFILNFIILPSLVELYARQIMIQDESRKKDECMNIANPSWRWPQEEGS